MRAETDNEVTDWQRVADWRDNTSVTMAADDLLSVFMGGSARLGTITGLTLYIDFTGTVSASTTIGGTEDLAATTLTTPTAGAIRSTTLDVSEWADSWVLSASTCGSRPRARPPSGACGSRLSSLTMA